MAKYSLQPGHNHDEIYEKIGEGGGGVTDHGLLDGLADDDHSQYLNNTRHDTTTRHALGTVVPHDDHGALSGLADNDHPQYLLTTGKAADADKLDGLDSTDFGRPVFLTAPLTSTSWDGDARSTTNKTLIDLSTVFGAPAGIKAVLVKVALRDSASASGLYYIQFSGVSSGTNYSIVVEAPPVNDRFGYGQGIVPCDANGDIYYNIIASGSGTMDIYLEIWGYWL